MPIMTSAGKKEFSVIDIVDQKAETRKRKQKLKEMETKVRAEFLPFCMSCWNRDYPNLNINWKTYCNMKQIDEKIVKNDNPNSANYEKPIGIFRDYECERTFNKLDREGKTVTGLQCPGKHSIWIGINELPEDYFKKESK